MRHPGNCANACAELVCCGGVVSVSCHPDELLDGVPGIVSLIQLDEVLAHVLAHKVVDRHVGEAAALFEGPAEEGLRDHAQTCASSLASLLFGPSLLDGTRQTRSTATKGANVTMHSHPMTAECPLAVSGGSGCDGTEGGKYSRAHALERDEHGEKG